MRTELVFKRNTPKNQSFEESGERFISSQISLPSKVEEAHVCLQRKPCVLEAGASSTLFSCEY
jgi:hypothetical protein